MLIIGEIWLSITTASKLYINLDIPPAEDLMKGKIH